MEALYACLFSTGHIKVGRSMDPKSRIAAHAERVGCVNVELIDFYVILCSGPAAPSEGELIRRCADAASARNASEWFAGLDFATVCAWANECAAQVYPQKEPTALRRYLDGLKGGEQQAFAESIGITPVYLSQLAARQGGRMPSPSLCVRIERQSAGAVTRRELRDDAADIWQDLHKRVKA